MTYNGIMFVNIPHCEMVCDSSDETLLSDLTQRENFKCNDKHDDAGH